MKNILFRADSSSAMGIGHIMRDLVLAQQFKDDTVIFATQDLKGNINYKIEEAGYKLEVLNSNDVNELIGTIQKYDIDMIVIDHYEIDELKEKQIKKTNPNVKILSFDDTYEKHYCDIVLNHNISANPKRYKGLVPKNCEFRCGSKYTLLRDEFYKEKKKRRRISQKNKVVFIAMGGTDSENISLILLKTLEKYKNLEVNLVTTSSNSNLDILKNFVHKKKWITLYVDAKNIAKVMRKSDFAIITSSVIVHEVLYMELPFIAIKTAENQDDICKYLKKHLYYCISSIKKMKKLRQYIKELV